jgi:DNA phosphorothioation-dependent restriction protein DptG
MRIEAYLRVLGDEATIRAIHSETNLPNASIKRLKARRGASDEEMWWNWQTERTAIDTDNPDDGLRALLQAHRSIFPIIKKNQTETDIYLEVVTQYDEGEETSGAVSIG